MSWITLLWSLNIGVCLTLAAINLIVWLNSRNARANLFFSIACFGGVGMAMVELLMMRSVTPAEYGQWMQVLHLPVGLVVVSTVWFIRFYLNSRLILLAGVVTGLRVAVLVLNFIFEPNLNFRAIHELRSIQILGEAVVVAVGEKNPWTNITHLSAVLFLVFVILSAVQAYRKGLRRRAFAIGCSFATAIVMSLAFSELFNRGLLSMPLTVSFAFLIILFGITYELSADLVNAGRTARDLQLSEARLKLATHSGNVGLWDWNIQRNEFWVSDVSLQRMGVNQSERITFELFLSRLHTDDQQTVRHTIEKALEGGTDFLTEYRLISPDGVMQWILAKGVVERDENGYPISLRGATTDVTERKRVEGLILKQRADLTHAARLGALGELVSSLAHELNQPLTAILSSAQAAKRFIASGRRDAPEIDQALDYIVRDDKRAGEIIRRVRAMVRKEPPPRQICSLNAIVLEVLELLRNELIVHSITVRRQLAEDLPSVKVDIVEIQQVLINIILNAVHALKDIPVGQKMITLRTETREGKVCFHIRDSGPGIPGELLATVLNRFTTTQQTGLGMGLAICRSIMERHNGSIRAENHDEGGAIITCCLPSVGHSEEPDHE